MSEEARDLKSTVNLPQTEFPIRAGLANVEPALLEKWENEGLRGKISEEIASRDEEYVLHDGPPYPNGDIHMGHALNKILKDIVVRSQFMAGKGAPYRPGWDCHGLPIETQLIKQLKKEGQEEKKADVTWFRDRCKDFALGFVDGQREGFKRLGINGEWEQPYLTLDPAYETQVVKQFGKIAENGLVYKGKKPIHWCSHCQTALAEAEIEHAEHRSPSVFVRFSVLEGPDEIAGADVLVWTTTPWTLPANVALAVNEGFEYVVIESSKGKFVLAKALLASLSEFLELENVSEVATLMGSALLGTITSHPLYGRESRVYPAGFVTDEDGTGFVHIAPGHGQDDYFLGMENELPVLMPVDDAGKFTSEVSELEGQFVFDANKAIGMAMDESGKLVKLKFIKHSYPHCWRCKNPVIFRATEQWFIAMDETSKLTGKTLREMAMASIDEVKWFPDWGKKRITSMVEGRPDWCISRQRYWGIPVPVFNCKCGHSEMGGAFNAAVVDLISKEGTAAWFSKSVDEILPMDLNCSKCGKREFEKESDILDVWFESGASFASVVGEDAVADLYLEGSDQHRGWFQSSMLIGLGARGKVPYSGVLTHGFIVDDKGLKMSKSMGNVISPEFVIKQFGADVLRWWVAGTDFKNDIHLSQDILKQAQGSFQKVRNTLRFLLSNLYDFTESNLVPVKNLNILDQLVLADLKDLDASYHMFSRDFDFHRITKLIHQFCSVTLSSGYLDSVKDRLYCEAAESPLRRSAQSAIYILLDHLLTLLAPYLVFSAEDAYRHFAKTQKKDSIHLEQFGGLNWDIELGELKSKMQAQKERVYQVLEELRKNKEVRSFMEVKVSILDGLGVSEEDWAAFLVVSQVEFGSDGIEVLDATLKCQRCWRFLPVQADICNRCEDAISE